MFHGLAAFPLTPMNEHQINERELVKLIERLVTAGVSSIGALGSINRKLCLLEPLGTFTGLATCCRCCG
jgi:hypothetical protein